MVVKEEPSRNEKRLVKGEPVPRLDEDTLPEKYDSAWRSLSTFCNPAEKVGDERIKGLD